MRTRSDEQIIPFISLKVDRIYPFSEKNLDQGNPPEFVFYSKPYVFSERQTGNLNLQIINPILDPDLLPSESNLNTGNTFEFTKPGYEIRKSYFEIIDGPSPLNLQNAYNSY